jgi:hypothetical protein
LARGYTLENSFFASKYAGLKRCLTSSTCGLAIRCGDMT